MSEGSRRFTDREVAMVLKKASEIDESGDAGASGGLSLEELTDIAGEVGISKDAIRQAVAGLDRRGPALRLSGAPPVHKAVHAIPSPLDREAVAGLVKLIDERTDTAGAISEALGSVRWTSSDRFKSTRVSITPGADETLIEVVEQTTPRLRRIMQFLPAAWGAMFAVAFFPTGDLSTAAMAALLGAAVVGGAGLGRAAWALKSAGSKRRVDALAEGLAGEARAHSNRGKLPGGRLAESE